MSRQMDLNHMHTITNSIEHSPERLILLQLVKKFSTVCGTKLYSVDEICGSHGDYYHVVVEVLGCGAMWMCRSMPMSENRAVSIFRG
jgi:hypothetical protein